MARDRQRSKARQRARAAQQQGGRRPRRPDAPETGAPENAVPETDAPDLGLDESTLEDSGLVAPGMEHSSSGVDIARAAEAGIPMPDDEHDYGPERADRAPDELELPADLRRTRGRRGGRGGGGDDLDPAIADEHGRPGKDRSKIVTFLQGCIDELGRVQWPDRPHVFQATAVVLGFVLIAGGYLGLMDAIWQPLINAIL